MRRRDYVRVVDFHEDDDEEEERPRFCPHCLEYGFQVKLGPKILMNGEVKQPNYSEWLQCHECGNIYPVYEAKYEQTIQGFAQLTDNPFDDQKGQVLGFAKRYTKEGKMELDKRQRERTREHHKDPEIDALLRIYGEDNVHIIGDSDPWI
jgi:hypothetical protein